MAMAVRRPCWSVDNSVLWNPRGISLFRYTAPAAGEKSKKEKGDKAGERDGV